MSELDRAKGTLLGLAWGDVLGCPVEGWHQADIAGIYEHYSDLPGKYPTAQILVRGSEKIKRLRPLGLHSDDTQQALALLNVCLSNAGWNRSSWASLLVDGMKLKAWRGYGRNFNSAIAKLRKGVSPQTSGSSSAGIGAAMRISVLGGLFRNRLEDLNAVSMESSLITHGDIRAGCLAYAVAWASAALCEGTAVSEIISGLPQEVAAVENEWLTNRSDWTIDRSAGHLISNALKELLPRTESGVELRNLISTYAKPHLADGFTKAHPNQGFVLLGGIHGLKVALDCNDDPQAALCEIIRQGYDTDTVAAIAGGILGARFGISWIPLNRLIDSNRLMMYAEALATGHTCPESRAAFLKRETELTEMERTFQREMLSLLMP